MKSLFEEMGGTYRQEGDYLSAKAVVLCEYVIHVVLISVLLLAITPSVQHEAKWVSERSVWMLRSDALLRSGFFTAVTTITGILSSLSVTLPPFDWLVFLRTSCKPERSAV